jgi:fructose-1-phosphate kinase PfkB-like protein
MAAAAARDTLLASHISVLAFTVPPASLVAVARACSACMASAYKHGIFAHHASQTAAVHHPLHAISPHYAAAYQPLHVISPQ